ncbi:hypothetical protein FPZ12_044925 [Amycolatopsis acidicola]|uniref:Glycoside hydrolase family 3 C-terminal domain-containing protein n=1 Tax=Amycolatopsis acidicola TaxID=2596893 RepID=A0A5N0UJ53_9PSEU|nr:hypothetical protein FPZ12_044925 [Amycolatopsis acidicola]
MAARPLWRTAPSTSPTSTPPSAGSARSTNVSGFSTARPTHGHPGADSAERTCRQGHRRGVAAHPDRHTNARPFRQSRPQSAGRQPGGRDRRRQKAKTAVVFAYTTNSGNLTEPLPEGRDQFIADVAAANPNTIVVPQSNAPVSMPWLGNVKALLEGWFPGDEGGWAFADLLTGKVSPSGHLPFTWFRLSESGRASAMRRNPASELHRHEHWRPLRERSAAGVPRCARPPAVRRAVRGQGTRLVRPGQPASRTVHKGHPDGRPARAVVLVGHREQNGSSRPGNARSTWAAPHATYR